jgi:hypothetical protein
VESKVHSALRPPMAYCASPGWLWWLRNWCNDWQGKSKYSEKTYPSAALFTTNATCCPDANPGSRGGKPATNRLSYGTARTEHCAMLDGSKSHHECASLCRVKREEFLNIPVLNEELVTGSITLAFQNGGITWLVNSTECNIFFSSSIHEVEWRLSY